ncbi:hypothetical protein PENTCL1PPCAC_23423, partial [Pristionchus entomophagus]
VFVVKENGRIGILATIQEFGQFPNIILFAELCKVSKCSYIAIHGELLDSNVRGTAHIEANIRLFIARRKSILICLVKLSIDSGCIKVIE